jgi:hypothetical protein
MEKSDFVVTLPSNSNMITHPTNRGHNYVVKLASPINLSNETLNDNARWEVALTSMQYTNHFYQLLEDATIYAVVIVPDLNSIQMGGSFGSTMQLDVDFTEEMSAIAEMTDVERRILRPFVKDESNKDETWFIVFAKFVIPAGEYRTPMELARRIAKEFSTVFNIRRYQYRMQVERVGSDGRFRFSAESRLETSRRRSTSEAKSPQHDVIKVDYNGASRLGRYNFLLYTDNILISAPLGQKLIMIDDAEPPVFYIPPISINTPTFSTVTSLYVYTDIVDQQRVGDTYAQLMDILPVQGVPGQRVHYVFDPPTYLPVTRNFIETINVIIHDGNECHIVFPDDVDNVVCRLHFRRVGVRI